MVAAEIAAIVRQDEETVRRWFARCLAEGIGGLSDAPRAGAPPKATAICRERLLGAARGPDPEYALKKGRSRRPAMA